MILTLIALLLAFATLWIVSLFRRDASIVDPAWGPGFLLATGLAFTAGPGGGRPLLTLALVAVWALRLGGYLWWRARSAGPADDAHRGHREDFRYAAMRAKHGARFWWVSGLTVFGFQAVLCWVISLPLQVAVTSHVPLIWLDFLGATLWLVGFGWEAVADAQLARFKARRTDPQAVLDTGLWALSRHPNYFGEWLLWWGFFALALAAGGGWTLFAPVIMSVLLMRVSGVPLLEKKLAERPAYRAYVERTPAFFPRIPRPPKATKSAR